MVENLNQARAVFHDFCFVQSGRRSRGITSAHTSGIFRRFSLSLAFVVPWCSG